MRKREIERLAPVKPRKDGWQVTVQEHGGILICNVFNGKKELFARHAHDLETHEYATWFAKDQKWKQTKIESAIGMETWMYGDNYWHGNEYKRTVDDRWNLTKKDEERIRELLAPRYGDSTTLRMITDKETDYGWGKRQSAEQRRWARSRAMMDRVPEIPEDFFDWADGILTGGRHWLVENRKTGEWQCSCCGAAAVMDAKKLKDGREIECQNCGRMVTVVKRAHQVKRENRMMIIQTIDEGLSVMRHFKIISKFDPAGSDDTKTLYSEEEARLILFRDGNPKHCDIYWGQWCGFDNKSNPCGKRILSGFLYPNAQEIGEALTGTYYQPWARLFGEFASKGLKLDYNAMMIGSSHAEFVSFAEMLFRGRFWKILQEESSKVSFYGASRYWGHFNVDGRKVTEVFGIEDRQKINRIREADGDWNMVRWMQWSEGSGEKVTDEALKWIQKAKAWPELMQPLLNRMTLTQAVNYVKRQQKESYEGRSASVVISQYSDYLDMCRKLKKNLADELVSRPRELKRRHDEAVTELQAREAKLQAAEYSKKYREAEKVLKKIREKYEWEADGFRIVVPRRIVDVVLEGRALHHCVASTERYFDRIKQNETYICFLRKSEAPEMPFYTIEVEPGGTIRQHRGYLDEEPEIETVKPFLRKWQKVLKKRMDEEDKKLAEASSKKRMENIEELKAKNNTRVLEGLMEDFMEAM